VTTDARADIRLLLATTVVLVGILLALLQWSGAAPWISSGDYRVRVLVPTTGGISPGASVRISGLRVGQVTSAEQHGPLALVTFTVADAKTPLPEDSRVNVRLRSLVGESYIEVTPGTSDHLVHSGGTLSLTNADDYTEPDQVLSVLRGKTRERARRTLRDLGPTLADQGERVNSLLGHANGAVNAATDITTVLDKDRQQVAGLVQNVGYIMRAIGDRTTAVRSAARSARLTFTALAQRDNALRQILDRLPGTLSTVRETSGLIRSVSQRATPVVSNLSTAIGDLQPAVDALQPAANDGRRLVAALSTTAPRLVTTLAKVRAATPSTVQALPRVRSVLCQLNPIAKYLSPYARDLGAFVANLGSATNFYDATGHAARIYAMVGQTSVAAISPELSQDLKLLQQVGIVGSDKTVGYEPYPAPLEAGIPHRGHGETGPPDSTIKYPRIRADC
jgi:virulence factor Mce-like protein